MEVNKRFNIACMVHNAYHYYVERYGKDQDLDIDIFGSSLFYFNHDANLETSSYDMLVLYSSDFYSEFEEVGLDRAAEEIQRNTKKDITLAYLYSIPESERVNEYTTAVILKKISEDGNLERRYLVDSDYDVLDLLYETMEFSQKDVTPGTPIMKTLEDKK